MCVLIFSTNIVWNVSPSKQRWAEIWSKMYVGLRVKYHLFLSDINETWIFSSNFRKNIQMWNLMNIRPVGAELFHADRRRDRHDETNSRTS